MYEDKILCVWQGTILGETSKEEFVEWLNKTFDIQAEYVEEVITLPCPARDEEGGRTDQFFFIQEKDVPKFALARLPYGIRWWSDIYFNNQEYMYPKEFLERFPDTRGDADAEV